MRASYITHGVLCTDATPCLLSAPRRAHPLYVAFITPAPRYNLFLQKTAKGRGRKPKESVEESPQDQEIKRLKVWRPPTKKFVVLSHP